MFCKHFVYSQSQINSKSITYDFENSQKIKIDSTINFYSNQQKKSWLNLLPSFNYNLKNQSFNVGISLNSFAQFYQQKQRNKIEVAKLEQTLNTRFETKLEKLNLSIEKFFFDYEILKNKIEIFKVDFDLFHITKGKYTNSEITTEQFLQHKKTFLINKKHLKSEFFKLQFSAKKINIISKNTSILDSIIVLKNKIKIYEKP